MSPPAPRGRASPPSTDPLVVVTLLGAAAAVVVWCGTAASYAAGVGACPVPAPREALSLLARAIQRHPSLFALSAACRPNRVLFWLATAMLTLLMAATAWRLTARSPASVNGRRRRSLDRAPVMGGGWGRRVRRRKGPRTRIAGIGGSDAGATWASRTDVVPLIVRAPERGRLVLGRFGRHLLAAESRQSVLVVGPTQTMKTSGLAIPALLEWDGPALVTSVKTDILRDTLEARSRVGRTWVYDPAGATGMPSASWSPLAAATTWAGARRAAAALVNAARSGTVGPSDADFWYATAAKLLAPLLFAAAVSGGTMADVVRWVDTQETTEVVDVLAHAGVDEALLAAEASFGREERARSSIFTTAETVLDPFADPGVGSQMGTGGGLAEVDPGPLLDGGRHTLYLCAPSHEQRRLRPLFSALVDQVVTAVYERASAMAAPLDPPLLVLLDEAAAIAPLEDLDGLAATGAGQGIQLMTVWQDLSQISARYGTRSSSVVNNHRAKVLLSGVSDTATLDQLSSLAGDSDSHHETLTTDATGSRSTTESTVSKRLASVDMLRRILPGRAVVIYGHLPPVRVTLRPWFADRTLSGLVGSQSRPARNESRRAVGIFGAWKGSMRGQR